MWSVEPLESSFPIIFNKVTSPRYVTPTLRRARLLDWLHERATCRAVVLAADAGYGKTTLLWQWEREVGFPCYWYKLDRNDRDWTFHISYLIESISKRHAGFGRRAHSMLQQMGGPGSSRPGVAAFLLAEMHERLTEPCTFIIDDWQYVASVTEVRGLWNQILRDAPATCRFVFASRAKPQLQFARFKTHAGYQELRTDALRFTDVEIDELFRDVYHDPLDPTELVELEKRNAAEQAHFLRAEPGDADRTERLSGLRHPLGRVQQQVPGHRDAAAEQVAVEVGDQRADVAAGEDEHARAIGLELERDRSSWNRRRFDFCRRHCSRKRIPPFRFHPCDTKSRLDRLAHICSVGDEIDLGVCGASMNESDVGERRSQRHVRLQ